MSAMKASEDALLNDAKASAVANDAIIPRRPHRGGGWEGVYFTLEEFVRSATATAHGIANVPTAEAVKNLERLVSRVLDPLREAWGSPIIVTSGYRCEELNARVGGVKTSYHLRGMAADIRPKNGFLYELYAFVERMFVDNKMPITECYIDHQRGYIHIAYDADDNNTWPFIAK